MASFSRVSAFTESKHRINGCVDSCLVPIGLREKPWANETAYTVGLVYEARGYKISPFCMVTQTLDKVILVSILALATLSTLGLGIPTQALGGTMIGLGVLSLGTNLLIGNLKERKFELLVGFLKMVALATVGGLAIGGILHPVFLGYTAIVITSSSFSLSALITMGIACNTICCRQNKL